MRQELEIPLNNLKAINDFILSEDNPLVDDLLEIVEKYGGVDEINRKAQEARKIENVMSRLKAKGSHFVEDLEWLMNQRDRAAFISI
ncbi:MAG: hypothetical protein JSV64_08270, partial [Candidatus Bathyarchaeota archaeon]